MRENIEIIKVCELRKLNSSLISLIGWKGKLGKIYPGFFMKTGIWGNCKKNFKNWVEP